MISIYLKNIWKARNFEYDFRLWISIPKELSLGIKYKQIHIIM
jgi:hypothetical protein